MPAVAFPAFLILGSGVLVGLALGLVGGGSILAVPLLVYLVGVPSTHVAIGTASLAVAFNAASGLASHARLGTVKWPCALVFAAAGVAGALGGAALGKQVDETELLALFGLLMMGIGVYMLVAARHRVQGDDVRLTAESARHLLPRLILFGAGVGVLSGFFGIGGGFLIVPGLMLATGMALQNAIGTSLFAVTAFGLATASSYAVSDLVDWRIALLVIVGGVAGTLLGARANRLLADRKRALSGLFAGLVIGVGLYIVVTGLA